MLVTACTGRLRSSIVPVGNAQDHRPAPGRLDERTGRVIRHPLPQPGEVRRNAALNALPDGPSQVEQHRQRDLHGGADGQIGVGDELEPRQRSLHLGRRFEARAAESRLQSPNAKKLKKKALLLA